MLYAGTYSYGVWKNNGTTWTNTGGGVSTETVWSLTYDQGNSILYAGTGSQGVWKYRAPASSTWYLAEGTTAWGFSTWISIENPNTSAVHAAITYMTGTGNVSGGTMTLPAQSQTTVNPADKLGNQDFSTRVACTEGKAIAVDRTMS